MNDLMREEFEAAFVEEEVRLLGEGFRTSVMYMIELNTINVRSAWWAWQASRESLVIEVPELINCGEDMGCAFLKAIEAAGVKYK